jgi:hypothetical protein
MCQRMPGRALPYAGLQSQVCQNSVGRGLMAALTIDISNVKLYMWQLSFVVLLSVYSTCTTLP